MENENLACVGTAGDGATFTGYELLGFKVEFPNENIYLGAKLVKAKPATYGECYNGDAMLSKEKSVEVGYKVTYEDGYESWSPKDVFEKAYKSIEGMAFEHALTALKNGFCVARLGWNGKGLYVCKQVPAEISEEIVPKMQSLPQSAKDMLVGGGINYKSQMLIINSNTRNADSWVPSSSDIFAEDWTIIN